MTNEFREVRAGGLRAFIQRMAARLRVPGAFRPVGPDGQPGILAITADLGFYSCVSNAVCDWGWSAEWASSIHRGLDVCRSRPMRIVVYDRNLPDVDWRYALDRLSAVRSQPRILLAAPRIDEDLWRMVLHRRGYDVLSRSASAEQLRRELRFAWLSLCEPQPRESETAAPALIAG